MLRGKQENENCTCRELLQVRKVPQRWISRPLESSPGTYKAVLGRYLSGILVCLSCCADPYCMECCPQEKHLYFWMQCKELGLWTSHCLHWGFSDPSGNKFYKTEMGYFDKESTPYSSPKQNLWHILKHKFQCLKINLILNHSFCNRHWLLACFLNAGEKSLFFFF